MASMDGHLDKRKTGSGKKIQWLRSTVAGVLFLGVIPGVGCGGDSYFCPAPGACYVEYYPESGTYDPDTQTIRIVGILRSVKPPPWCHFPSTAEVVHVFRLSKDERYIYPESFSPISEEEYEARRAPIHWTGFLQVDVMGRGTVELWKKTSYLGKESWGPMPCQTIEMEGIQIENVYYKTVKLFCGCCKCPLCGDYICQQNEDLESCPEDCTPEPVCGDGVCEGYDGTLCREDCACDNQACNERCDSTYGGDFGYCNDHDPYEKCRGMCGWQYGQCRCFRFGAACDGSEPFCDPDDYLRDRVVICDPDHNLQAYSNCDSLCWEQSGVGGYCGEYQDGNIHGLCNCAPYGRPCEGNEPFCHPGDQSGERIILCDPNHDVQVYNNCNVACEIALGFPGHCDIGGTEDCVCDGPPCDGNEPYCLPDEVEDPLGVRVAVCYEQYNVQVIESCRLICMEQYYLENGYCDAGGTEDCVCE